MEYPMDEWYEFFRNDSGAIHIKSNWIMFESKEHGIEMTQHDSFFELVEHVAALQVFLLVAATKDETEEGSM